MAVTSVPTFAGVTKEGSPDVRTPRELARADSFDLTDRGTLVLCSESSAYTDARNIAGGLQVSKMYSGTIAEWNNGIYGFLVAAGINAVPANTLQLHRWLTNGNATPIPGGDTIDFAYVPLAAGYLVTWASFPVVKGTAQSSVVMINIGPRATNTPRATPGLYVLYIDTAAVIQLLPISNIAFNSLGTGAGSTKQLFFRGITTFNSHVFGWGFDDADTTSGEGPNRLMFSNREVPFTWGKDDQSAASPRVFTDSDAITIGGAGETIRGALEWNGRLYLGTNRQMHYVAGYGRDSFLTDGSKGIGQSENLLGPYALAVGPDGMLYGLSSRGLWIHDGQSFEKPYGYVHDSFGRSLDWFDLIWYDGSRTVLDYPGVSNSDLVWLTAMPDLEQVWVGIPFCNATSGYGYGTDTVVLKWNTRNGGWTRQVFLSQTLTKAMAARLDRLAPASVQVLAPGTATSNIRRYGYKANASSVPALPVQLGDLELEWTPFGPTGVGVVGRGYITISWDGAPAPGRFAAKLYVDDELVGTTNVAIGTPSPSSPAEGDLWLDLTGTDTSLGNATPGSFIAAAADYVLKRYSVSRSAWQILPFAGQKGSRATIPIPFPSKRGTRVRLRFSETAINVRYQIEGLGIDGGSIREAM